MKNISQISVIGNPNCGKTTLFNVLTGSNQRVGNWSGVTVEKKTGILKLDKKEIEIVDLPGIYSINCDNDVSIDEKIARDFIISEKPELVLNIVDATNLERSFYLSTELFEMQVPMIIVINMTDVADKSGIKIDVENLEKKFSCSVIKISAGKGDGIKELKNAILNYEKRHEFFKIDYDEKIEELLEKEAKENRWKTINAIEIGKISTNFDADFLIADARFNFINKIVKESVKYTKTISKTITDKIDNVMLGKVSGFIFFLAIMYFIFYFSAEIGGGLIEPVVSISELIFIEKVKILLEYLQFSDFLKFLLTDGLGGGIVTIISFIPPIACLFFSLSILEDTGYMARIAFLMDRFMKSFGLSGTAFVPMLIGFGCSVPALMGTRTLQSKRDRLLTMMMIPFMSCGAKFPVYAVFVASMFKSMEGIIVFSLYISGILVAIITGLVLRHTLLLGKQEPMVLELPRYHLPIFNNILIITWQKLKGFVIRAGTFIIPLVIILNIATSVGIDGSVNSGNLEKSYLALGAKKISVIFEPMGINENNWQAVVGIVTGVMAKEAVVGTLSALYVPYGDNEEIDFTENNEFLGKISNHFDGMAGAYAYLLFILLYVPCLATVATVFKEAGNKWGVFMIFWTTSQAYIIASCFYQIARFDKNPLYSSIFLLFSVIFEIAVYYFLRRLKKGKKNDFT